MTIKQRVAVVTGCNRGIGLEVCTQLSKQGVLVVLTARDEDKGLEACERLHTAECPVRFHTLDVDHAASIEELSMFLEKEFGRCDILINNAAIFPDVSREGEREDPSSIFRLKMSVLEQAMQTNLYGPLLLCQALVPLMKEQNYGRIVNLSSGLGQLYEMGGNYPAYRFTKTAINALTRMLNAELHDKNILVNSVCPGWVKTDMGGPQAPLSVAQGADTIVWLATLEDGGPRGKFFRDREEIPW